MGRAWRAATVAVAFVLTPPRTLAQGGGAEGDGPAAADVVRQSRPSSVVPRPSSAGSELTVYHMVMGQGDAVWERFGHNAIWIHDAARGTDAVYNWGMFDFDQPNFLGRFVTGDTQYWMAGFDLESTLEVYGQHNRPVWVQELNLTPAQRDSLRRFVEWNARPENMYYRYDYYRDNCSTRVRDALDLVLGGAIRRETDGVSTGNSYRWHTRRLLADDVPVYTGTNIGLGHPADRPISRWEEMFLPTRMQKHFRSVVVSDGAGGVVPLVRAERQLVAARRPPERGGPPSRTGLFLSIGAAIGALLLILSRPAAAGSRGARISLALLGGAWSAVVGLLGAAVLALSTLTRHVFTQWNENLLQFDPLALALVVLLPLVLLRRRAGRAAGLLRGAAVVVAVLAAAGLALKVFPAFYQQNAEVIALALPTHLAMAWAAWRVTRPGAATATRADAPPLPAARRAASGR